MYLKSLELQGFKSFPDKTKLVFEKGTTIIVGPNGSGKSNISDAMRWVLGEISTKSIRGTKMEDIIFGGADSRKPMGYAEVSVTFDNSDKENRLDYQYDEVVVTRRYYRAGESEYYINRQPVRLKDIYELFMNTGIGRDGYSIIGQGKIAEIISQKSDERRSIFEDASGIAKYRHKKTDAERKLSATEENMTRINDVFAEVSAQVGPLEKEAEKASRAIALLENKKKVDIQLWLYDTDKLKKEVDNAEELFKRATFDLQTADEALESFDQQNTRIFECSQSSKMESEKLLEQIKEQTEINHSLESEYRITENNIEHTKELRDAAQEHLVNINKNIDSETSLRDAREVKISELRADAEKIKTEYDSAQDNQKMLEDTIIKFDNEISTAFNDLKAFEADAVDVKVRISVAENARNTDSDKNISILKDIESYENVSKDLNNQCITAQTTIDSYAESLETINDTVKKLADELTALSMSKENKEKEITKKRLLRDSIAQRIETFKAMDEQFEGYNSSVRFVMKMYSEGKIIDSNGVRCDKIYGPLSKVIAVDDKYVVAVETALGINLQNIVVEDETVAKAAMYALKNAGAGRATFFPISSMRESYQIPEIREAEKFKGFISVADKLVNCEKKFSNILSSLLGRTVVFDNIDNATAMARALKFKIRAVTLDGQQINAGGSFTGGSIKQENGILGRAREIKRLQTELVRADEILSEHTDEFKALCDKIEHIDEEKNRNEDKHRLVAMMHSTENARYEQFKAKLEANNTLLIKLREDYDALRQMSARYDEDIELLRAKEKELSVRISEISEFRAQKDIEKNELEDRKNENSELITRLYIRLSEAQKDIEFEETLLDSTKTHIAELLAEVDSQTQKILDFESVIAEYKNSQEKNRVEFSLGEKKLDELNKTRAKTESDNFEFERKLNAINLKIREKNAQRDVIFREYTKCEAKLSQLKIDQEKLSTRLWDEYELTRTQALEFNYPALDASTRAEAAEKQTECKNKLRAIGNVDLDAVSKYKEIKERYDYMDAQIKDLTLAKNDLLKIINGLESEMKTAFVESFNKINENFNRVFAELFGGGSAEISLANPDDVLNSGIEIKAAPPGKIIKSLMQLSGGEQAFVAIALFFAILQVNPTPFCILDEIEAALDEVNVARFADYIKRYSDDTQFVLITHRRGTMEAANRLYGVTMPERGISKVLTLDVNNISKGNGEGFNEFFE